MKLLRKYPLESLCSLVFLYYVLFVLLIESTSFANKVNFVFLSFLIYFAGLTAIFAFKDVLGVFNKNFFKIFLVGGFSKLAFLGKLFIIILKSLFPLFVFSTLEFLITLLLSRAGGITIGFPMPVYSFVAGKILFVNLVSNFLLYGLLIYIIGKTLEKDSSLK